MVISFSGLDGAGKSTLIDGLKSCLEKQGYSVKILSMYDHLSLYAIIRNIIIQIKKLLGIKTKLSINNNSGSLVLSHPLIRRISSDGNLRDPKIGVSDKKNIIVRFIYGVIRNSVIRRLALFFDLLLIWFFRIYFQKINKSILITDRYLYDSLADVADLQSRKWLFIRIYLFLSPTPDVPVLVDVSPREAYQRKGEYPIHYMKWRRATYQKIFEWVRQPIIIKNNDLENTQLTLDNAILERITIH